MGAFGVNPIGITAFMSPSLRATFWVATTTAAISPQTEKQVAALLGTPLATETS